MHLAAIFDRYATRKPSVPFARVRCWHEQSELAPESLDDVAHTSPGEGGGGVADRRIPPPQHWSKRRGRAPRVLSHADFLRSRALLSVDFLRSLALFVGPLPPPPAPSVVFLHYVCCCCCC